MGNVYSMDEIILSVRAVRNCIVRGLYEKAWEEFVTLLDSLNDDSAIFGRTWGVIDSKDHFAQRLNVVTLIYSGRYEEALDLSDTIICNDFDYMFIKARCYELLGWWPGVSEIYWKLGWQYEHSNNRNDLKYLKYHYRRDILKNHLRN